MKYVIINDFDKPCARMVAVVCPDGAARYIHPDLVDDPSYSEGFRRDDEYADLQHFGFDIEEHPNGDVDFYLPDWAESAVTYFRSDKVRKWQGETMFTLHNPYYSTEVKAHVEAD